MRLYIALIMHLLESTMTSQLLHIKSQ